MLDNKKLDSKKFPQRVGTFVYAAWLEVFSQKHM